MSESVRASLEKENTQQFSIHKMCISRVRRRAENAEHFKPAYRQPKS